MLEQIVFWLLTGVFIILVTLLGILFKKNLDANIKQAEAVNGLTVSVAALSQSLDDFKITSDKAEEATIKWLESHDDDISNLKGKATEHQGKLDEHGRRINILEKRRVG
jgi:hypothetical protein